MSHDKLRKQAAMAIWRAVPDISSSAATIAADAAIRVVAQAMQEVSDEMCAATLAGLRDGSLVAVPREPSEGLLMSIALRLDHAIGWPGYYDNPMVGGEPGGHVRRVEVALSDARKAHEEIVGAGFYTMEREAEYRAMLAGAQEPSR